MKCWPTKPLGKLLTTLENGFRPKGGVGELANGIPSLGGEHITRQGGFVWDAPKHVTRDFYTAMKRGRIQLGDILVVKDGATTGKTATVRGNFPFCEAAINEHIFLLRTDKTKVLPEFVGYFLFGPVGQQQILANFRGAAIGGITQDFVLNVHVPLPPLAEQERIVKLLDEADELRKLRAQADRRTATLIPALFHDMFGGMRHDSAGWPLKSLAEVTTRITKGESPGWQGFEYTDEGPLFVTSENVLWGELELSEPKHIPMEFHKKLFRSMIRPNDVLLNLVGASIGRACLFPPGRGDANVNQAVAVISCGEEIFPDFLLHVLLSNDAQSTLHGGKVEAARANISLGDVRKFRAILPPLPLQKEFAAHVSDIHAMEAEQSSSRSRLDDLFQSMLHRAFNGEL